MANKRAHVAATINATSASEFFTQDMEDMGTDQDEHGPGSQAEADAVAARKIAEGKTATQKAEDPKKEPTKVRPWDGFQGMIEAFQGLKKRLYPYDRPYKTILGKYGVEHCNVFPKTKEGGAAAYAAYKELLAEVVRYEAEKAALTTQPTEPFETTLDDLPPELGGTK